MNRTVQERGGQTSYITNGDQRLPNLLRYVTTVELVVLVIAGAGLFFLPGPTGDAWPWDLTPFNTRFQGAIYLSAMVAVALMLVVKRWTPAWNTVWVVFGFTAIILVNSLAELDRFEFDRPGTWAWFALYVILPVNAAYHLWRYWPGSPRSQPAGVWALVLQVGAALFAVYTVGLIVLPGTFTEFWPWPIDNFHARTYSAAFASLAIGFFLTSRSGRLLDLLTVGITLLTFSSFALAGLLIVDADREVIDWSSAGTWLWVGGFAALLALSIAILWAARPALMMLTPRPHDPDRTTTISRGFALLFGAAFVAAGISGFLPVFTTAPPANAASLEVTTSYGYLLGIYPVNVLHSLIHLGFGITAFAAYFGRISIGRYSRVTAVILGAFTVMGLVPGLRTTFGLVPLFGHDIWLHAAEALVAGYVGFILTRPMPSPTITTAGEPAPQSAFQ